MMAAISLMLFAAMFSSCKKDDKKQEDARNTFTCDGETYSVNTAAQLFMGETPFNTNGVSLLLADDNGIGILLVLFVPTNKDRLVAHDYVQNNNGAAYTIGNAAIVEIDEDGNSDLLYEVEDVTAKVSLTGGTYTINITGSVDDLPLTGNYTGELSWIDGSDEEWPWLAQNRSQNSDLKLQFGQFNFKTVSVK